MNLIQLDFPTFIIIYIGVLVYFLFWGREQWALYERKEDKRHLIMGGGNYKRDLYPIQLPAQPGLELPEVTTAPFTFNFISLFKLKPKEISKKSQLW